MPCALLVHLPLAPAASNVLHFEVKRVKGSNGIRRDSNSSGIYDSTNTSISTTYVSLGTISVPSPVDVKVNWAFTLSGTGGTGSIVGNTAQTGATYSLSDNTFQTLTNGQSAGFLATVSTSKHRRSQSRYLVINNLPLTLQKSGYTTEEVADFEGQLTTIAVVSGAEVRPITDIFNTTLSPTSNSEGAFSIEGNYTSTLRNLRQWVIQ